MDPGRLFRAAFALLFSCVLALGGMACGDPVEELAAIEASRAADDLAAAEQGLRRALERHPDDVPLLIEAADFYLQPAPERYYRPRLALHYALRADRAADFGSSEVGAVLMRAYRATGGMDEGHALVEQGLRLLNHPDAGQPQRLRPVDADLLEPTFENLKEQARRERVRAAGPPTLRCPVGMLLIPAGSYPRADASSPTLKVEATCIHARPAPSEVQIAPSADSVGPICEALGRRMCSEDEREVACDPLRGILGAHPACEDLRVVRCCQAPEVLPPSPR